MNMTWVRYANKLEEENTKLKGLLEEALDCIDQYDYEESFDLVQRIKDSLGSKPLKAVQWGDNAVTEAEELLQKVQQLERDKLKMLADLQVESEINAKGGEREYVLRGKVDQLERENAALRKENRKAHDMACEDAVERYRLNGENAALRDVINDIRSEINRNDCTSNLVKVDRVYCILRDLERKETKP
jgi:outer membrane murein-binding lipoprotein Lpp